MTTRADTQRRVSFRSRVSETPRLFRLASCLRGEVDPDVDWFEVIATANQHLLGPQLYRSLRDSEDRQKVDPEVMEYLADMDWANRERNRRLYEQLTEVAAGLSAAGLVPIALKGAAILVRSGKPNDSPRMLRDLDILVEGEDGAKADEVLRGIGYELFGGTSAHSSGSYYRADVVGAVDLHVRLPGRFLRDGVSAQSLWEDRTQSVMLRDGSIRIPDSSLHFVINIAHDMLHDRGLFTGFLDLRCLLELVALCRDPANPLDWSWIQEKRTDNRFRLALELQSRMAEHLGEAAFPGVPTTALGRLLHARRLFKARHERLGCLEWAAIRWAMCLSRPRTSRPVPNGADLSSEAR